MKTNPSRGIYIYIYIFILWFSGASICLQHCEGQSPSPPLPSLPLEVSPLNQAKGSGERCKLLQWGLGRSPSRQRFWCIFRVQERCWWHSRCTVWNIKTAFLYVFMKKFSKITVRVQAIKDPHNQIIARVRTCGPSRDRLPVKQLGANRRQISAVREIA